MFKITIDKPNGEKVIIEAKTAVVLYGGMDKKDIITLSEKDSTDSIMELSDLVTNGALLYAQMKEPLGSRRMKLGVLGMANIINKCKFNEILEKELADIEAELAFKKMFKPFKSKISNPFKMNMFPSDFF
jgi:hypothetical protein